MKAIGEHWKQLLKSNAFFEKESLPFDKVYQKTSIPIDKQKEIFYQLVVERTEKNGKITQQC